MVYAILSISRQSVIQGFSDSGYLVSEKCCIYFTRFTLVTQRFHNICGIFMQRHFVQQALTIGESVL